MKTILCSEEQKPLLLHRMLTSSENSIITEISLRSVANLLHSDENTDDHSFSLRLCHTLQQASANFPIYRAMFRFPAFIQEILTFARECARYSIKPDTLPADTASEAELAGILEIALRLPLNEKQAAKQRTAVLQNAASLSPMENHIRFEADPFNTVFLKELKAAVPQFIDAAETRPARSIEVRSAPGVRQEIEACAQAIIQQDVPCAVVLCSYETQLPVLKQVFSRYGIPFSAYRNSVRPQVTDIYVSLALLALRKDRDSLLAALECDAFSVSASGGLITYLRETLTSTSPEAVHKKIDETWFPSDRRYAEHMDQSAEYCFSRIRPELNTLLNTATPAEALTAAFELLRNSPALKDSEEMHAALAVRTKLNQTIPLIETEEDAVFILREIASMTQQSGQMQESFCMVTDTSHPVLPADTLYVLGCSGKQFPGVPLRKGVFDEAYTAKVPGYPSMKERYELWTTQLSWLENSSDKVIYSYANSDYQGREIQPSFEITSRFGNPLPWKIDKRKPARRKAHTISEETAHALYEQDGVIHSSVSRIERWFSCPYSWFLQSGLKIRKPMRAGLDAASFGNIQHAMMDHAVKTEGSAYASITEETIRSFLAPAFASLRAIKPNEITQINLSEERVIHGLAETMRLLEEIEQKTPAWSPIATEQPFTEPITSHVTLNGIIDRIDVSSDSLRILDYKSSAKSLSEDKIKAGLQLQLLSYLIIAAESKKRKPAGAYYISMKSAASDCSPGKFGKTNKNGVLDDACTSPNTLHASELSARRIEGWAFDDTCIDSADYKIYFKPGTGRYSFETVEQCIRELYEYFYSNACSGSIAVDPVASACMFCDYKAICRFHMPPRTAEPVVMQDAAFKVKKEAD